MSQETRYFHFTIGPVQGFVAQARRTRDFWAGSFLLSWLAGVAMREVVQQQGRKSILFPRASAEFLDALDGSRQRGPQQGTIPNRFKARVNQSFNPNQVKEAVETAWQKLADHVWARDLAGKIEDEQTTRNIWNSQINSFWKISWAITEDEADSAVLDRRKNWRTHLPPPQAGVKCMMMEGWQELSGAQRPNDRRLKDFWDRLSDRWSLDLRKTEHLCAIAFVKRRFVHHFEGFSHDLKGWTLHGWRLPRKVPSVVYMAAVPWLETLVKKLATDSDPGLQEAARAFVTAAEKLGENGEYTTRLRCIQESLPRSDKGERKLLEGLCSLDGSLFFESALENVNVYEDQGKATEVRKHLARLRHKAGVPQPSSFYALLLMDGDSLGKQMSILGRQDGISAALEEFTNRAKSIVEDHSGFLIYAGGDDVLALLPLHKALDCATELHREYGACFDRQTDRDTGDRLCSTLSGAIVFAHYRVPLTKVLKDAHPLLDEVAKDGRGRDAVALRVRNPGGDNLTWAMPWDIAIKDGKRMVIQELAEQVSRDGQDGPYASGFFYRVRELLELLNPVKGKSGCLEGMDGVKLMTAEYLGSGRHAGKNLTVEQAQPTVERLLEQCWPRVRKTDEHGRPRPLEQWPDLKRYEADGALLVRFLAREGRE